MSWFLTLDRETKAEVLATAAQTLGKAPQVLEKDFWVCWCLERLFTATDIPALVFKGGTSLSKVYGAIDRFSEDVDITISGSELGFEDTVGMSNSARDKSLKALEGKLLELARGPIRRVLEDPAVEVTVDDDASVWVRYESAESGTANRYLRDSVKVELGARNPMTPAEEHGVSTDLSYAFPKVSLPKVDVQVLSPVRTFWEKATILHAEYHRASDKPVTERIARHYYDLSQLAEHEIGQRAIGSIAMLDIVAEDKARLFRCGWARYDLAKPGTLRMLPSGEKSAALEADLTQMIESGMFTGTPPTWASIVERLSVLETKINAVQTTELCEPTKAAD